MRCAEDRRVFMECLNVVHQAFAPVINAATVRDRTANTKIPTTAK